MPAPGDPETGPERGAIMTACEGIVRPFWANVRALRGVRGRPSVLRAHPGTGEGRRGELAECRACDRTGRDAAKSAHRHGAAPGAGPR